MTLFGSGWGMSSVYPERSEGSGADISGEVGWYFYIISNANRTLYAGITSDLVSRFAEHKMGSYANGFTTRYNFDRLVYFEWMADQHRAAQREKQVKGWRRSRKIELI